MRAGVFGMDLGGAPPYTAISGVLAAYGTLTGVASAQWWGSSPPWSCLFVVLEEHETCP